MISVYYSSARNGWQGILLEDLIEIPHVVIHTDHETNRWILKSIFRYELHWPAHCIDSLTTPLSHLFPRRELLYLPQDHITLFISQIETMLPVVSLSVNQVLRKLSNAVHYGAQHEYSIFFESNLPEFETE